MALQAGRRGRQSAARPLRTAARRRPVAERTRARRPRDRARGELALLTGSGRSASAQAVRASELLEIDAERFHSLLADDSQFAVALARELARQLQESGGLALPGARPALFAVVPLGGPAAVEPLWSELRTALAALGTVGTADGPARDGESDGAFVDRLERAHDHVLLLAAEEGAWRRFCVRQSDRVLLVAGGRHARLPDGLDAERTELVFPPESAGSIGWHGVRPASRTHHVLETGDGYSASVRRLARRLSGRALGLVFSGGGARGLAHIGALQGLEEAGFEVDRLGGCSIGAFIGGMAALGLGAGERRDVCQRELVRASPFNDYTVPRVSLIRSRKAERMLTRVFGEQRIEELPKSMLCVSADLVSSTLVVHRDGPVVQAVGASMSISGLAPPLLRGAGLLVTGACSTTCPST